MIFTSDGFEGQQNHKVHPLLSLVCVWICCFGNCLLSSSMDFVTIESPCDEYMIQVCSFHFSHHGQASLRIIGSVCSMYYTG